MSQTTVQTILDRFEIIDVFNRYARLDISVGTI